MLISKLLCSLVEQQESLTIIDSDSILYNVLEHTSLIGKYYCSYGINSKYIDTLASHGLALTAKSEDGQVRAFEIKSHPFFVRTHFQPALTSAKSEPNPIILEFVKQSIKDQQ